MLVWFVLAAAVLLLGVVFYYIYGPGYEKHLCADDPPINPQHPLQTQQALQFVRAYARANGKTTDFTNIITTPQGGFDTQIGDVQSFAYDPAAQKLIIRTVVDAQLDAAVTPELAQFSSTPALHGGALAFIMINETNVLVVVHEFASWTSQKSAFVKLTELYAQGAKEFDALLVDYLQKKAALPTEPTGQTPSKSL